jgi:hypothetical protein
MSLHYQQTKVYQIITLDREIERLRIRADQNPERVRTVSVNIRII